MRFRERLPQAGVTLRPLARAHVRQRNGGGARKEKEKEEEEKEEQDGGRGERESDRERIQYNCTHVYRVDGNILERILKYLLVV